MILLWKSKIWLEKRKTRAMSIRYPSGSLLILFLCFLTTTLCIHDSLAGGFILKAGIGIPGTIHLGSPPPKHSPAKKNKWNALRNSPVEYKLDQKGRVSIIRCKKRGCITSSGVAVGAPAGKIFRWNGTPVERIEKNNFLSYRYPGVTYMVQKGRVRAIFIHPRLRSRK